MTTQKSRYESLKQLTQIQTNPHFGLIGGKDYIVLLVDQFYYYMDSLPEAAGIRNMHPADIGGLKETLVKFLVEWMGGPKEYSTEYGHPRLRMKHMHFPIGATERDAWMLCMGKAMDDVIDNQILKQQLEEVFFKTADFIRNDRGSNHA